MISKSDLDAYRERVFAAMRAAGLPVDQWHRNHEEELARDPTAKARPFTKLTQPKYGKIQKLRPGFEEFIPHPRHGKPVPRCQAARKRTGGKEQCRKFAANGTHLCRSHGGASGSGKLSELGRQKQIASVTQHGNETTVKRRARSDASKELRELNREMIAKGQAMPALRGPRPGKNGLIDLEGYLKRRRHNISAAIKRASMLLIPKNHQQP